MILDKVLKFDVLIASGKIRVLLRMNEQEQRPTGRHFVVFYRCTFMCQFLRLPRLHGIKCDSLLLFYSAKFCVKSRLFRHILLLLWQRGQICFRGAPIFLLPYRFLRVIKKVFLCHRHLRKQIRTLSAITGHYRPAFIGRAVN